jgi:hypothetical protein
MTREANAALLEELRREYGRMADRCVSISAIAGREIDHAPAIDYWSFDPADLENELWSRMPELESGLDIVPDSAWPSAPGRDGRIRGRIKRLIMRLAMPLVRHSLEKQGRFNHYARHMHFIHFLALKQMRRQVDRLEGENRELRGRLDILESMRAATEPADHD